jgi:hypothetical protein
MDGEGKSGSLALLSEGDSQSLLVFDLPACMKRSVRTESRWERRENFDVAMYARVQVLIVKGRREMSGRREEGELTLQAGLYHANLRGLV